MHLCAMIETMKILLNAINAKYIHSNLAVYSLRAYAKRISGAYQTVRIYDQQQSRGDFRRHLQRACGCHLFFLLYLEYCVCKGINRRIKKLCPNTPIWVGGPEVSYEIETLLAENPGIDGVFIGEGEHTFKKCAAVI